MQTLTPGHRYSLANHEDPKKGQVIQFIEKAPSKIQTRGPRKLVSVCDGTTNEEVLTMLIDRLGFLLNRLPSTETLLAAHHCDCALHLLQQRTAERQARNVEGTAQA